MLAGAAGWTGGQRLAEQTARVQNEHFIQENCALFAEDVQEQRAVFLQRRYELLASSTPAAPCLAGIPATATQLAQQLSLSAETTLTPVAIPVASSSTPAPPTFTASPAPISTHDLQSLAEQLEVARQAIRAQDYPTAIEYLETIQSADPSFDPSTVNALLLYALRMRATYLFAAGELAPAILLVNRAEEIGLPAEDPLRFSRLVATYYLDARRWMEIDATRAIQDLEYVRSLAPNYAPTGLPSAQSLLAESHRIYAEVLLANQDPCAATTQFERAIQHGAAGDGIISRLHTARENCNPSEATAETSG
ncbi:MAG: hypothetical protein OXG09_03070 [Chloroflexi bacterium]|nr:hypothetical protein [Chloroflexota bacterium]